MKKSDNPSNQADIFYQAGIDSYTKGYLKQAAGQFAKAIFENPDNYDSILRFLKGYPGQDTKRFLEDIDSQFIILRQQNNHSMLQPTLGPSLSSNTLQYADKNFSGDVTNIPKITSKLTKRTMMSVLYVFNALDFSTPDNPRIMQSEFESGSVSHIGFATMIGDQEIITSRHILNNFPIGHFVLYSQLTGYFYDLSLIEDGASQDRHKTDKKDFFIGRISPLDIEEYETIAADRAYPPFLTMVKAPRATCEIALINPIKHKSVIKDITDFEQLTELTTFDTEEGDCGSPYITPKGHVFALHCKRSDSTLQGKARTGVTIEHIVEFSEVLKTANGNSDSIYLSAKQAQDVYYFHSFSTVISELSEVDESGKARVAAVGPTPTVKDFKSTVQSVLKRFFLKGKAKLVLKYKSVAIEFSNTGCKIPSGTSEKLKGDILKKFCIDNIDTLISDSTLNAYWQVSIYPNPDSKKRIYQPLIRGNPNVIHMGHKIPAICFWRYGSDGAKSYVSARIERVKKDQRGKEKGPRTENEKTDKINQIKYDGRYARYKQAGYLAYSENTGKAYIKEFMEDPRNYSFQSGEFNIGQSNEEASQYGTFNLSTPDGYIWESARVQKTSDTTKTRLAWKLIPADDNFYKFPYLTDDFKVTLSDGNNYPINSDKVRWLTTAQEKANKNAKANFLKQFTDDVTITIDKAKLAANKVSSLQTYMDQKRKQFSDNKFIVDAGFFKIVISKKNKPSKTYEQSKNILDTINSTMKP